MSIAPFSPAPTPVRRRKARRATEARRTRLALIAAFVGIAAALLAYAISPTVRHAVGHAEHSMKHTVSNIFDHDRSGRSAHKGSKGAKAKGRHRAAPQRARARVVHVYVRPPAAAGSTPQH